MANAIYPKFKEAILNGSANTDMAAGTVRIALVDTGVYTFSAAHEFQTSLTGVVATQILGTKTFLNGTFDAADPTWPTVTGATVEALVIYIDTGVAGTSRLISFVDTGQTGLPVTPNGGNITLNIAAGGLFTI
tara:strand:+ start:213 stop:611 length:399 start_codon:yes stop_codon:yes gene_type:complete